MLAAVVMPQALAWLVAFALAIAPLTSTINTLSGVASTTDKIVTGVKSDIAKHEAKKKRPQTAATSPPR